MITVKFLRGSRLGEKISGVCRPIFTKLGEDIRPSRVVTEFVPELRYLAAFSNTSRSKMSHVEHEAKFRTF